MEKRHIFGVCASGPSLTPDDVKALRGKCGQLMAINTTYQALPGELDHVYACDFKWWERYYGDVLKQCPQAAMWCYERRAAQKFHRLLCVEGSTRHAGLCRKPMRVHTGNNSGYQALNLAYHLGAKRIILLGYDMQGKTHWHGHHPQGLNNSHAHYEDWRKRMQPLAKDLEEEGVEVINATRNTALECFTRLNLEQLRDIK